MLPKNLALVLCALPLSGQAQQPPKRTPTMPSPIALSRGSSKVTLTYTRFRMQMRSAWLGSSGQFWLPRITRIATTW